MQIRRITIILLVYSVSITALFAWNVYNDMNQPNVPFYDLMFNGVIVDLQKQSDGDELATFQITKLIRKNLHIEQVAHLNHNDMISIVLHDPHGKCIPSFDTDRLYTVYADFKDGMVVSDTCNGIHPYVGGGSFSNDRTVYPVPWDDMDSTYEENKP